LQIAKVVFFGYRKNAISPYQGRVLPSDFHETVDLECRNGTKKFILQRNLRKVASVRGTFVAYFKNLQQNVSTRQINLMIAFDWLMKVFPPAVGKCCLLARRVSV